MRPPERTRVQVSPGAPALLAVFVWLSSPEVLGAVLLAALCHELGHYAVLCSRGGWVRHMEISALGANMQVAGRLSYGSELLAAAGGPAVNLLLAAALAAYGISVVHDRTLHDGQSYNDAYENSLASIRSYLAKYPSIVYVLDLHRDAVQDANGTQYKLVTAEDPSVAQVSLIMGVAHDGWQDNLRLAIAVQEKLETQSPTLMRPITLLNYRYNQFAAPGSLLVEVGAAGNSLEEALQAARLFGKGFAETILGQ